MLLAWLHPHVITARWRCFIHSCMHTSLFQKRDVDPFFFFVSIVGRMILGMNDKIVDMDRCPALDSVSLCCCDDFVFMGRHDGRRRHFVENVFQRSKKTFLYFLFFFFFPKRNFLGDETRSRWKSADTFLSVNEEQEGLNRLQLPPHAYHGRTLVCSLFRVFLWDFRWARQKFHQLLSIYFNVICTREVAYF